MKKKQISTSSRLIALALVLVMVLGYFSGVGAFFTSTDSSSDTYTVGKVSIELIGNGNSEDFSQELLLPLHEYTLQRQVENVGLNEAYVYMTVSIPYTSTLNVNKLDGEVLEQAPYTQVMTYGIQGDKTSARAGVNNQFKLVENGKVGDISIDAVADHDIQGASDIKGAVDEDNNCITYVYAYVDAAGKLLPLAKDDTTGYLFDLLKVANLADAWNMKTDGEVLINAYAIQTKNILTDVEFAGREDDGTTNIELVWEVIQNACAVPSTINGGEHNILAGATFTDGETLSWSDLMLDENGAQYNYDNDAITDTTLENGAFQDCDALQSIVLPDDIEKIGENVFDGCSNLAAITYEKMEYPNTTSLSGSLKDNDVDVAENSFGTTAMDTVETNYTMIEYPEEAVIDDEAAFRSDADYSKFVSVKVDGVKIDPSDYTTASGSTIAVLNRDFVNTLSLGEHSMVIKSNDGFAQHDFTVGEGGIENSESLFTLTSDSDNSGGISKSDIITIKTNGVDEVEFLVIDVNGDNARVIARENVTSLAFNTNGSYDYENSDLQTYLNDTYYNALCDDVKNAIVPQSFTYGNYGKFEYADADNTYTLSNQYVFALDCSTMCDYLDFDALDEGHNKIKTDFNRNQGEAFWLASSSRGGVYVVKYSGGVFNTVVTAENGVRPAFVINLPQLDSSVVMGPTTCHHRNVSYISNGDCTHNKVCICGVVRAENVDCFFGWDEDLTECIFCGQANPNISDNVEALDTAFYSMEIDADNSGSITKGDIINVKTNGTDDAKFTVIKVNGDEVELLARTNATVMEFDKNGSYDYEGSSLQVYLNETWKDTLDVHVKNALVVQNGLLVGDYNGGAYGAPVSSKTIDGQYVFALDISDITEYLDDTSIEWRGADIVRMFNTVSGEWNNDNCVWLRSSYVSSGYPRMVSGWSGDMGNDYASFQHGVHPAFVVKLADLNCGGVQGLATDYYDVVSDNDHNSVISKGDIISIKNDGTTAMNYLVLDVSGNNVKVLGKENVKSVNFGVSNDYFGSYLQSYLEGTWKSALHDAVYAAIVPQNVTYGTYDSTFDSENWVNIPSLTPRDAQTIESQYIFAPDIGDLIEYFGGNDFSSAEYRAAMNEIFGVTNGYKSIWLRSVLGDNSDKIWCVNESGGALCANDYSISCQVRPVFVITLSDLSCN